MRIPQRVKDATRPFRRRFTSRPERINPEGSITAHRNFYSGGGFERKSVKSILERFGLKKLVAVHGVALTRNSRGVVLIGPHGIGKSSTLRRAGKKGARVVDDGIVLLGEK